MEIKPMLDTSDEILSTFTTDELERRQTVDIKALSERCLVSRLQQNLLVLFSQRRFRWPTSPPFYPTPKRGTQQTKSPRRPKSILSSVSQINTFSHRRVVEYH